MKRWIRSMAALLFLLWVLPMGAFDYEVPEYLGEMSLESVMAAFMEDNGLNEENFSIS